MSRFDTAITGGTLVVPFVGVIEADLGIKDGRIASIADSIAPPEADSHIDADGKVVLPGAIDAHLHLGIFRDIERDAVSETSSAAVGGVTTVLSYFRTGQHYLNRSGPYKEIFPDVLDAVAGKSKVDYGFHVAPMTSEHIREMPWLASEMGVTSFKYYMFYKGLNLSGSSRDARGYTMADEYDLGHLFEMMETAAHISESNVGRISVSLHCEQPELLRVFIERAKADASLSGLAEYSAGRPPLTERLSIEEAAVLAQATGVSINFLHLSSEAAIEAAVDVGQRYPESDFRRETTLHHLMLAHEELTDIGLGGKVNPPIRTRSDNAALWGAVQAGQINWVASDHACCMESLKGDDLWEAQPGFGGTALLYPLLISEGFHKRNIPLVKIAELGSAAPALAYNLYPRKGTITVGADADLAIVDLDKEQVVTADICQSAQDYTPFEGCVVKGWPTATVLRGETIFEFPNVTSECHGQYLRR